MRRVVNALLVLSLAVSLTSTTAYAASRRNGGDADISPLRRIVQLVKKVIRTLDDIDMSYPKP